MKISFSTLGCPEWSWEDMLVTAKDLGFDGIELRGIENELFVPKAKPFSDEKIQSTMERIKKINLEIPCLTSSCYLFDKNNIQLFISEGQEYIDLANKIGASFVRVLGDANPEPGEDIDLEFVAENLRILGEHAEGKNVKVLIESNGVFSDSHKLIELLDKVNNNNVAVLWDVHHPYRFGNEPIETTYERLKNKIAFVHIKDSIMENGKIKYKMMGYGDIPVKAAIQLLSKNQYSGYVSLEWVKRWCIELEEPGVVFSQFVNYIKDNQ